MKGAASEIGRKYFVIRKALSEILPLHASRFTFHPFPCYHSRPFASRIRPMEVNLIRRSLEDLNERYALLRGFL